MLVVASILYVLLFVIFSRGTALARALNLLLTIDCMVLSVVTLGKAWPGESISSAAYRAETLGLPFGRARPVIDFLFFFQPNHCYLAWLGAKNKRNLPDDMRTST